MKTLKEQFTQESKVSRYLSCWWKKHVKFLKSTKHLWSRRWAQPLIEGVNDVISNPSETEVEEDLFWVHGLPEKSSQLDSTKQIDANNNV